VIEKSPLPLDIAARLNRLGPALEASPVVVFAYLFGGAAVGRFSPLLRKIAVEEYVGQLREYRDVTLDQYRADWKTQRVVERTLQLSVEGCADIGNHVIADRRLRIPATYAEIVEVLGEAKRLHPTLPPVFGAMSRFRNLLVHDYARVDPARVLRILKERLEDFDRFRAAALTWLD
jgi:uncharacterized protein YutE (UPF0331/DUF86 family)